MTGRSDRKVYRELSTSEREYLCEAYRRFATAMSSFSEISEAADEYHSKLDAARIVYTSKGFRVHVEEASAFSSHLSSNRPR